MEPCSETLDLAGLFTFLAAHVNRVSYEDKADFVLANQRGERL